MSLELALLTVDDTTPGLEWRLTILTQTEYEAGVYTKALESSYPTYVYLERSQPVNMLHIWPVPTLPYTLQLLPWKEHSPYESYDAVLYWPAGYQDAFEPNLAVRLAPFYGVQASPRPAQRPRRASGRCSHQRRGGAYCPVSRAPCGLGGLSYPRGFREGWG